MRKIETIGMTTSVLLVILLGVTILMVTGCDEGMNMAGSAINNPIVEPGTKDPMTNGEVKQQEETKDPEKQPEPLPTVTISTVTQADDMSITVSGTSTDIPEGEKVTITLGDDTVTTTAVVAKDGSWAATVPAKKTVQLARGMTAVKVTAKKTVAKSSFQNSSIPKPPEPTLTIGSIAQADNGSVTVSGTSTEIAKGATVKIVLGNTITVTTTINAAGAWSITVPAAETAQLSTGTAPVTATANTATAESSFNYAPPKEEAPGHGIVVSTEADRIKLNVIIDVWGYNNTEKGRNLLRYRYETLAAQYAMFDVETEVGRAAFQRFIEYEFKKANLAISGGFDNHALLDQLFGEAYGISADYARWLVYKIYLPETGEEITGLWQTFDIAMEHLLLRIANPNATEEEILELLRESIRAGKVSIAA